MNDNQPNRRSESANPIVVIAVSVGALAIVLICCVLHGQALIQARNAAARLQAKNNLAQVKEAIRNYHAVSDSPPLVPTEPFRFLSWNIESGGNDPAVIAEQLAQLGHYDIFGLSEVAPSNTRCYLLAIQEARGTPYESFVSVTGRSDRLLMIYSKQRLELLDSQELEAHDGVRMNSVNFRHRSPLVGHFRDKQSDAEFLVVLVHLARGNADVRREQAEGLRLWAADQDLPVIGIGDFNFDYEFANGYVSSLGAVWSYLSPLAISITMVEAHL